MEEEDQLVGTGPVKKEMIQLVIYPKSYKNFAEVTKHHLLTA